MLLKIIVANEETGEVVDMFFTDEDIKFVRKALFDGSQFGVSIFETKEEYDEANKEKG